MTLLVELDVAGDEALRHCGNGPPAECAQPCQQLGEGKGLGEIVVRARIKTGDSLLNRAQRRQDQDRRPVATRAKQLEHLGSVDVRQHSIKHDGVIAAGLCQGKGPIPSSTRSTTLRSASSTRRISSPILGSSSTTKTRIQAIPSMSGSKRPTPTTLFSARGWAGASQPAMSNRWTAIFSVRARLRRAAMLTTNR